MSAYLGPELGEWGEWSTCSALCDGGERTRSRDCENWCTNVDDTNSDQTTTQTEACNPEACCETSSWLNELTLRDNNADWPQNKLNFRSLPMPKVWNIRLDAKVDIDDSTGWQVLFHGTNADGDLFNQAYCGGRIAGVWITSDQHRIDNNIVVQEGEFRKVLKIMLINFGHKG